MAYPSVIAHALSLVTYDVVVICWFQRIRSEGTYDLPCTEARAAINRNLNRYRDVLPYDHTRIVLTDTSTSYINASLVRVRTVLGALKPVLSS